ncbi:hypothetical protein [Shewanella sp. WE21]|uniref:hypothetical protein n=1 Tax=Shewanella sp. WE21 TaxID=2029986 RepID=UPI001319BF13|nr:hypothetical protein [Shewanella sp. WE21]
MADRQGSYIPTFDPLGVVENQLRYAGMQNLLSGDVSWLNASAVILLMLPIVKLLSSLYFEKHKINLKKLEIAQSVLSGNLNKPSIKQRYLTEQIFTSIYKHRFSYNEINVLLKYMNPSQAFDLYVNAGQFLELSNKMNSFRLNKHYWRISTRYFSIYPHNIYLMLKYFVCGFIGIIVLFMGFNLLSKNDFINGFFNNWYGMPVWLWAFFACGGGVIFLAFAFKSIASVGGINKAFTLIDMSEKSLK